ncbi:MAG: DUF4350 domain-containing protein [Ignavibacteriales bacterium]|nr:MAG: DUF4350 domain-containing protein [Ignavibacteriales bacterium]
MKRLSTGIVTVTIMFSILFYSSFVLAQQFGDSTYTPKIDNPVYNYGEGPTIFIDEAHNNFHTMQGRYKPFADVLAKDGYVIKPFSTQFTVEELAGCKILVIANALNERNISDWTLPTPSAFTPDEIEQLAEWVSSGGSLFLIADHMPFPGAAMELAQRFGFRMNNGFAGDTTQLGSPDLFTLRDKTLAKNIITTGRNVSESVDSIISFTGQAFQIPGDAYSVLNFNSNFISLMPDTAWNFNDSTPKISVEGWSQGAVKKYGKGRIITWGEAAMFTAQVSNERRVGLNTPRAKCNLQLLLNIIHWLDGKLD